MIMFRKKRDILTSLQALKAEGLPLEIGSDVIDTQWTGQANKSTKKTDSVCTSRNALLPLHQCQIQCTNSINEATKHSN
jgi:hypothetical protein